VTNTCRVTADLQLNTSTSTWYSLSYVLADEQFGGFDDDDEFHPSAFMGGFPGVQAMSARVNRPFNEDFRCYSMAMFPGAQRDNVDYGGKGTSF